MFGPVEFILAGVLVGFCVGITGVGGGSLMTPILISLFRIEPHIAIGTDLLYAAISKFCGSMVHAKKLNIVWPIVLLVSFRQCPCFIYHPLGFRQLSQQFNALQSHFNHGVRLYADHNRLGLSCSVLELKNSLPNFVQKNKIFMKPIISTLKANALMW